MGLEDGSEEGNAVSATNRRCRNKKQAGKDAAVQGTNDSSIVSKCSMVNLGYFCDGFLKGFVNKTIRRVPLINRGYYVRAKAVDYCLHGFLQHTESYPQRQIISLGAGFDSLYFRLKANGELKNVIMYEVDFPDVVQRKATLIKNKQELVELIGCTYEMGPTQMGHLCGMDYKLLGIDLSEIMELDNALMEIGLNTACPTLLLSEVVLTYMKNESSSAVIRWAADRFSSAVFVVYEQIRPNDPFGQVMQQHFAQLNSTLHALVRFPGKEAQQKRFLQEGWEECLCVDMNEFYVRYIPEQEKQRIEMLEPFDEYEEWHLKCSHYIILCASKGDLIKYLPFTPSPDFYINKLGTCIRDPLQLSVSLCETETQTPHLRRFAHCSALVAPHTVVTTGGFGNRVGQHGRLRDISLLAKSGSVWKSSSIRDDDNLLTERMFHSMTALCDSRCLIIGGRTSPLNPITSILCLKCDTGGGGISNARLSLKAIECSGTMPSPRWRHTATEVIYRDQKYLFIYGGRSPNELVLGDWHFLSLQDYSWTDIPVDGPSPESRHSHCACTWKGGALITGGLGIAQVPLGSIFHLRPTLYGFVWERIEMISSVIPRYSHTAHVLDDKLILLGGVLIHSNPVPEVTLIDLKTGQNFDCYIDTNPVKWPLMLHNHSSVLLAKERQLLVIGGGGNCFSFGTHLNHQPVLIQLPEIR